MKIIEAQNLVYKYPDGTKALDDIDFSVDKGSITAIMGQNGAGKSTLFLHLNATLRPIQGTLYLKGEAFAYDKKGLHNIRRTVGMVFQNPNDQLLAPTVRQDIAFGPKNLKLPDPEIKQRVNEALRLVGMEAYADKPPHFLSGGQKKRVAIAGVIAMKPEIIVLDEPTAGLDPQGCSEIIDILDELNAEGKTIIFSTHDVDLAAKWADSIYVLHEGRIKRQGVPSQIFADHAMISQTGLRLPAFVQTFRELKLRGISGSDSPLTMLNFVESVSKPFDVLKVRCAIAGTDVHSGETVGMVMKNGTLYTKRIETDMNTDNPGTSTTAMGKVMHDARAGEDIVVSEMTGTLTSNTGDIHIVPIPRIIEGGSRAVDLEAIHAIISTPGPKKIGAMGTSAKVVVRKAGIKCDFEVDVIQSSILAALRGQNVVVFATGGMVDRVIQKIECNNKQGGQQIKYSSLP
ncbi:MAG: ATP-binding cassette domain-containing protein [Candidatus Methanoperedens sp.]|nr:ATP-binding cassette domain-containing protein [Candidatus Methanoperedens sp.]